MTNHACMITFCEHKIRKLEETMLKNPHLPSSCKSSRNEQKNCSFNKADYLTSRTLFHYPTIMCTQFLVTNCISINKVNFIFALCLFLSNPYLTGKCSESSTVGPREPWLNLGSRTGRFGEFWECSGSGENVWWYIPCINNRNDKKRNHEQLVRM